MRTNRLIGFPVLLAAVAGCAGAHTERPAPTPTGGPRAHIYATYSGGLTQRNLRATFSVDQDANVLVGYLAGDGVIRILYPENARSSQSVERGKTYSVGPIYANYDGVPQLFSFTTRAWRSPGARTDSYDGRGNGFLFVIASRHPLYLRNLQENGFWTNDYAVEDYEWMEDPRTAIRYFADAIAERGLYTIKYANSFGTNAFTSYADRQVDCAVFGTGLGYSSLFADEGLTWWGGGLTLSSWYFMRPSMFYTLSNAPWRGFYGVPPACGYGYRTSLYAFNYPRYYNPGYQTSPTLVPPPTTTPQPAQPTTRRALGPRFEDQPRYAAQTRIPRGFDRPTPSVSSFSPAPSSRPTRVAGGLRNPERFEQPAYDRPSSAERRRSSPEDHHPSPSFTSRNGGGERWNGGGESSSPRSSPSPSAPAAQPAPAPAPAHSAGTPSPRVEAASAGKPRDP